MEWTVTDLDLRRRSDSVLERALGYVIQIPQWMAYKVPLATTRPMSDRKGWAPRNGLARKPGRLTSDCAPLSR
jgi:hypothetical protein